MCRARSTQSFGEGFSGRNFGTKPSSRNRPSSNHSASALRRVLRRALNALRTTVIAFVSDPDGYKIEFIERKTAMNAASTK